jgi:hypothetical protein
MTRRQVDKFHGCRQCHVAAPPRAPERARDPERPPNTSRAAAGDPQQDFSPHVIGPAGQD